MNEIAIRTQGLSRYFGTVRAVDRLTLEVRAGAVFGFLGPNGSGKTTTIRLLLGLLTPTAGRAEVLGFDIRTQSAEIRARAGVVLDSPGLYEHLTALENLEFWARAWHIPPGTRKARIKALLNWCGLWERRSEQVRTWSTGMKKRLALARALLPDPAVLLLDEPTAGLDVTSAHSLRGDLARLVREHGTTVFLSTHNMAEAEQLCTEVAVIRNGRLLAVGAPEKLRSQTRTCRVWISGRGLDEQIARLIAEQPHVARVKQDGNRLTVELEGSTDPAPLVALLVMHGVAVEEVRRDMANLEEVFLTLMAESEDEG
ncbi:MAG: ABC transporter ATP-binding protein [Thermoleophilia bacterium]|nr:ABC transporter ATP-binding protein [Thermoleophilia bacterium]